MRKLFYLSLILLTSCTANINLDKEKDISIETPEEKSWNLTIEDKDISYVLIASTMESGDMQFSIETSLSEVKQTVMVSHFPKVKKYALANLNENEYNQLIFIGTSSIRPENELVFVFYLDTSEEPYQRKNIPLPEIEETDGRKKLNSINTYSIKPPYIERRLEYQPLEGDLQKETIIYKITDDSQAKVVSIKAGK